MVFVACALPLVHVLDVNKAFFGARAFILCRPSGSGKTRRADVLRLRGRGTEAQILEHLECSLQPIPPACFAKKLSEARGNGIGFVAAGEAAPPS